MTDVYEAVSGLMFLLLWLIEAHSGAVFRESATEAGEWWSELHDEYTQRSQWTGDPGKA